MPTPIEVLMDPVSLGLFLIYFILIILETIIPAHQQKNVIGWVPKAALVFTIYFFLSSYLPLVWDKYLIQYQLISLQNINPYLSTCVALLVFEFMIYVWHFTMHRTDFLWRTFHQMHHSAERLDSFGAFYFSPLDMIGFTFIGSLSLTVFVGISPQAVSWFLYITMFLAAFQHTNIKTPQWLGYIIQRPESHSVHHARGVHAYNYSDLPIFDIIFGTFKNPKHFEKDIGFYDGSSEKLVEILFFKDLSMNNEQQRKLD